MALVQQNKLKVDYGIIEQICSRILPRLIAQPAATVRTCWLCGDTAEELDSLVMGLLVLIWKQYQNFSALLLYST